MQTDLKWEDVKVGDIITVELPYAPYLLGEKHQQTGEVIGIRDTEQLTRDPVMIRYLESKYLIRIKINEKEYVLRSHIWKLINIERKNKMETQEQKFKEGDIVLVTSYDVKRSLGFPTDEELQAEIVVYNSDNNILIHSKQLEKLELGHCGERPQQFPNNGCWWVSERNLQLVEKQPEFDIFI